MQIGPYQLANNLVVAPMAGVTDRPFRQLCRRLGAGLAVSEMISSDATLYASNKTLKRLDFEGEPGPIMVQILGADPAKMAQAAVLNVEKGAQIIDINMGCPAKKVCRTAAGSALLQNELLVAKIVERVVNAVDVPVTLKIRTGWDPTQRNGATIARIAEECGIQAVAVHGRTKACGFSGEAEYDTIKIIKQTVKIPIIANGDIETPEKAKQVLDYTGADGIMVGRAAQGRPWIFSQIDHYLKTGEHLQQPEIEWVHNLLVEHLEALYAFYGTYQGVRIARKHIAWYSKSLTGGAQFRRTINQSDSAEKQRILIDSFFDQQVTNREQAA
ncbi:MAG: tRNA dihydrouridine synthase DusB [Gammaproteobacteria bacterium]|nr:tRNA dihydrouridine synthase DusB [Gammaproteobacteria bacterium]